MGRDQKLYTSEGKKINHPADAQRRKFKKQKLEKKKKERQQNFEVKLFGMSPEDIQHEIKSMKSDQERKKAHKIEISKYQQDRLTRLESGFKKLRETVEENHKKRMEAPKSSMHVDFDELKVHRKSSVFYDAVKNPYGAPPVGQTLMYRHPDGSVHRRPPDLADAANSAPEELIAPGHASGVSARSMGSGAGSAFKNPDSDSGGGGSGADDSDDDEEDDDDDDDDEPMLPSDLPSGSSAFLESIPLLSEAPPGPSLPPGLPPLPFGAPPGMCGMPGFGQFPLPPGPPPGAPLPCGPPPSVFGGPPLPPGLPPLPGFAPLPPGFPPGAGPPQAPPAFAAWGPCFGGGAAGIAPASQADFLAELQGAGFATGFAGPLPMGPPPSGLPPGLAPVGPPFFGPPGGMPPLPGGPPPSGPPPAGPPVGQTPKVGQRPPGPPPKEPPGPPPKGNPSQGAPTSAEHAGNSVARPAGHSTAAQAGGAASSASLSELLQKAPPPPPKRPASASAPRMDGGKLKAATSFVPTSLRTKKPSQVAGGVIQVSSASLSHEKRKNLLFREKPQVMQPVSIDDAMEDFLNEVG